MVRCTPFRLIIVVVLSSLVLLCAHRYWYYVYKYSVMSNVMLKHVLKTEDCPSYVPMSTGQAFKHAFLTNRHRFCGDFDVSHLPTLFYGPTGTPCSKSVDMADPAVQQSFQESLNASRSKSHTWTVGPGKVSFLWSCKCAQDLQSLTQTT